MLELTLIYLLSCFLYFVVYSNLKNICNKIHQNAPSKNRKNIKDSIFEIEKKLKIYSVLLWPVFELYYMIRK